MKARELRDLSAEELAVRLRETEREMSALRLRHASGVAVEKAGQLRGMRREIARMLTILGQREKSHE